MPAVGPTQILGPLKAIFDVQIRIAAAPAAELRGTGDGSSVNERDAREARQRRRQGCDFLCSGEGAAVACVAERTAVVADEAKAGFIDQRRSKDMDVRQD